MVQRILLTREDKKTLSKNVLRFWNEDSFTLANFKNISDTIKLPVTLVETMALHYENLFSLNSLLDRLVFKGGTAVQQYLKPELQRGSVDLDFNTSIGNPSAVKQEIQNINNLLKQSQQAIEVHGVHFGLFEFDHEDAKSGTITFNRLLPTKLNESVKIGNSIIQGKKTKIQINYKHSWLPAQDPVILSLKLFPSHFLQTEFSITPTMSSPGDLICDKILTLTQVKDFGRERIKDVYDLYNLMRLDNNQNFSIADAKLTSIAMSEGLSKSEIISSTLKHLDEMKAITSTVIGFKSQVAKEGWPIIDNWENSIESIIKNLESNFG